MRLLIVWSARSAVSVVALAGGMGLGNFGCGNSDNGAIDGGNDASVDQTSRPESGGTDAPISSDIAVADTAVEGSIVRDSSDAGSAPTSGDASDAGDSSSEDASTDSGDAATPADSGDGASCLPPTTLHPPRQGTTVTLYCPFGGAGGGPGSCDPSTSHCCEGTSASTCTPTSTPCATGDVDWQCEDPGSDCPAGMMCCGSGAIVKSSDPSCRNLASNFQGTHCAAACTASEIVMCTSNGECPAAQTCLPFFRAGNQVGGCHGP